MLRNQFKIGDKKIIERAMIEMNKIGDVFVGLIIFILAMVWTIGVYLHGWDFGIWIYFLFPFAFVFYIYIVCIIFLLIIGE